MAVVVPPAAILIDAVTWEAGAFVPGVESEEDWGSEGAARCAR